MKLKNIHHFNHFKINKFKKLNYLLVVLLGLCHMNMAHAAEGFLVFWHEPEVAGSLPHTKTTLEDISPSEALAEKEEFCTMQNQKFGLKTNGCFGETHIQNTCVAAAYSAKNGVLRPDNLFIQSGNVIADIQKLVLKQCSEKFGEDALCEVETTYCSDSHLYQYELNS